MDAPASIVPHIAAHAVLAEVTCRWLDGSEAGGEPESEDGATPEPVTAVILHAGSDMLVLEAADRPQTLPPLGTLVHVSGETLEVTGRLAELGRAGRFLVRVGSRPVRRAVRMRVALPGTLRCPTLPEPLEVEIVDLTTAGARVRGVELPVNSQVSLDFTPPGRDQSVTVRALVAHGTDGATRPWVGLVFRLVAMRGGR